MKLAIVGQGAIGSLFAYYFRALRPTLLVRSHEKKAKTIVDNNGEENLLNLPIQNIEAPFEEANDYFDCLLIAVKGYQLAPLITQIKPWLSDKTRLILIQNGMGGGELLAQAFPNNLIYTGITTDAVFASSNTQYQITALGRVDLGPFIKANTTDQQTLSKLESKVISDAEKRWIDVFLSYHPNAFYHVDIANALYTKLAINAVINPLTAILQIKNGELVDYPDKVSELKQEVFAIYDAAKISLKPKALSLAIDLVIDATSENWSSMYQDVKHKRVTENETLLGYLRSLAKANQVNIPMIDKLYEQIANIDRTLL